MRSSRELKALTTHPRTYRNDTIMARILSEPSESRLSPSHSFCGCTMFWRGTAAITHQIGAVCIDERGGGEARGRGIRWTSRIRVSLPHCCGTDSHSKVAHSPLASQIGSGT